MVVCFFGAYEYLYQQPATEQPPSSRLRVAIAKQAKHDSDAPMTLHRWALAYAHTRQCRHALGKEKEKEGKGEREEGRDRGICIKQILMGFVINPSIPSVGGVG